MDEDNYLEDKTSDQSDGDSQQVTNLINVESMINTYISRIQRLKEDIKPVREMVSDYLDNDEAYAELSEVFKKASKAKRGRKAELMEQDAGKDMQVKLDTMKAELSEAKEALSDYLRQYQEMTGSNTYEGEDGEIREIRYTARLVRKTNLNK